MPSKAQLESAPLIANWRSAGIDPTSVDSPRGRAPNPAHPEYAQLPRGVHGIPREVIYASQKGRIMRACLELLGEEGGSAVSIAGIVARAHVSRKTFYEIFADFDSCVGESLATANLVLGAEMVEAIKIADASDPLFKIRTLVREFCQMSSEEPTIAIAVAGSAYSLNQPTRFLWLQVLNARRGIATTYWNEARKLDPSIPETTPDRAMAAGRYLEGRILELLAEDKSAELPQLADEIADCFIAILGG
jgi:AcrR family transcriptional regulator